MTSITVTATSKPAQTVATATATVEVVNAPYQAVAVLGLHALGESPSSVWDYGVVDETGAVLRMGDVLNGTYTVNAHRD